MKRKIINILFVLSLFQVIGIFWFLLFIDVQIFNFDIVTNPVLLPLFFVGPMLAVFVGFSGSSGLLTSALALLSPIVPFVIFTFLFLKANAKQQIRKIVIPILLITLSIFALTGLYQLVKEVKFQLSKNERADMLSDQRQLLEQGIMVKYAGIVNNNGDIYFDNGEEYFVHKFLVTTDTSVLNQLGQGTYQLCLRRTQSHNSNQNDNKCLIRSKLLITDNEPQVMFDTTLETDYNFTYSLIEPALEVDDDRLTMAVTGFKSSNQQQVAELVISGTERSADERGYIFGEEVIARIPLIGPIENTSLDDQ